MSHWTHVQFIAEIKTNEFDSKTALKEQVETAVSWFPHVTGSEGDWETFVFVPSGYESVFMSYPHDDEYGWDTAYIIGVGHLRDREKKETEAEVKCFIEELKRQFRMVRNVTYKVYGDGDELWYFRDNNKQKEE